MGVGVGQEVHGGIMSVKHRWPNCVENVLRARRCIRSFPSHHNILWWGLP